MKIGEIIRFGSYEWLVLDIKDESALIITEKIIEYRPYHNVYKNITWAECSLRGYLNNEFISRFSENDRSKIIPVWNKNHDNQWYGTSGGEDTLDSVFLLSIEEVACRYFGDSSEILNNPGKQKYKYWFTRKDENNNRRMARRIAGLEVEEWLGWWWLRSPGCKGVKAVYIHGDGNIGIQGNNIKIGNVGDGKCMGGVRPALWMRV